MKITDIKTVNTGSDVADTFTVTLIPNMLEVLALGRSVEVRWYKKLQGESSYLDVKSGEKLDPWSRVRVALDAHVAKMV